MASPGDGAASTASSEPGAAPATEPDAAPAAAPDAGEDPPPPDLPADAVLADWSERRVSVFRGGERVASFPAIFGRKGVGKERRGDERTPEGTYRLHRGRPSQYARFLPVTYPNAEDGRRGFAAKLITEAELAAILRADAAGRLPPQGTALGGQVGLHGFGPDLSELAELFRRSPRAPDGTRGCIMVLDEHVRRIEELVRPGVTLVIRE